MDIQIPSDGESTMRDRVRRVGLAIVEGHVWMRTGYGNEGVPVHLTRAEAETVATALREMAADVRTIDGDGSAG